MNNTQRNTLQIAMQLLGGLISGTSVSRASPLKGRPLSAQHRKRIGKGVKLSKKKVKSNSV